MLEGAEHAKVFLILNIIKIETKSIDNVNLTTWMEALQTAA
jgi:hypothetical protein